MDIVKEILELEYENKDVAVTVMHCGAIDLRDINIGDEFCLQHEYPLDTEVGKLIKDIYENYYNKQVWVNNQLLNNAQNVAKKQTQNILDLLNIKYPKHKFSIDSIGLSDSGLSTYSYVDVYIRVYNAPCIR